MASGSRSPPLNNPRITSPSRSSHTAPTLGDIELAPRRKLRDGSDSVLTARRRNGSLHRPTAARRRSDPGSRSSSGASAPKANSHSARNTPGSRVPSPLNNDSHPSSHADPPTHIRQAAEASRRLPRLTARKRRAESSDSESDVVSDSSVGSHSRPFPDVTQRPLQTSPVPNGSNNSIPSDDLDADTMPGSSRAVKASPSSASPRRLTRSPKRRSVSLRVTRSSTNSSDSGERRYTAAEKGKGRAVPRRAPSVMSIADSDTDVDVVLDDDGGNDSIQFISSVPAAEPIPDEPSAVIDSESALSAFTCPVCFLPPTNPAFTPCGHVLCYMCLHSSMVAAIQRQIVPWVQPIAPPRRRVGRSRRPLPAVQPAEWTEDTLRPTVEAAREEAALRAIEASGMTGADAAATLQAATEGPVQIEHPLKGVWKVDGTWIIEGECPVCRKGIAGGLGPLGSGIGGVTVIETRVEYGRT